jgi:hypothetical protein
MNFGKKILLFATAVLTSTLPGLAQYSGDMQNNGQYPNYAATSSQPTNNPRVQKWFHDYDVIRRQAQMTPNERQQADALLSQGLSIIVPGEQKIAARALLTKLVTQYQWACQQLKRLPMCQETANLHRGYYQYFDQARALFTDYLKVQDNLFVKDPNTGNALAGTLVPRKQDLEAIDQANKQLDAQLRQQFGIPAYRY